MTKVFGREIEFATENDVIQYVTNNKNRYAFWLGAGASVEAGIKTGRQICDDICGRIRPSGTDAFVEEWKRTELSWDDGKRRYSTCLRKYAPAPAQRIKYFRELIDGVQPSFVHHALALLMSAQIVKQTTLTTNFDKLIEMAFAQQGFTEYQAIRSNEEARFHQDIDSKCYIIKLHGDYDTQNILNTIDEIIHIPNELQTVSASLLKQGGLILIGSSGYEESVQRMLNDLLLHNGAKYPSMGVYWGINVGPVKDDADAEQQLGAKLKTGSVSIEAIELMDRFNNASRPCAFFPIRGAGDFLHKVVLATNNRAIIGRSHRYLDHSMRLRHIFSKAGLDESAIKNRLNQLNAANQRRTADLHQRSEGFRTVCIAKQASNNDHQIHVVYGDITSRSLMDADDFSHWRRAVISPDDNYLSAGGGASLALLRKARLHSLLHEMAKFTPIGHRDVVVTSGGDLPVQYILHAAATLLKPDGTTTVATEDVTETVSRALSMAATLGVEVIFVPLIASGTELMRAADSLTSILAAIKGRCGQNMPIVHRLVVVIRDEASLARADAAACMQNVLGADFQISQPN